MQQSTTTGQKGQKEEEQAKRDSDGAKLRGVSLDEESRAACQRRVEEIMGELVRRIFKFAHLKLSNEDAKDLFYSIETCISAITNIRIDNAMAGQMSLLSMIEDGFLSYDTCCHDQKGTDESHDATPGWHRCYAKPWRKPIP